MAALALGRIGDSDRAQKMADDLQKENPLNTMINGYWLPTIRAAVEINRKNPEKAIQILEAAAPYELGNPLPEPGFWGTLYPVYLRGQAYLLLREGSAAGAEFQRRTEGFCTQATYARRRSAFGGGVCKQRCSRTEFCRSRDLSSVE